jgi:hypothetical protein
MANAIHDVLNRKRRTDSRYRSGQDVPPLSRSRFLSPSGICHRCSQDSQIPRFPGCVSKFLSKFKSPAEGISGLDAPISDSARSQRLAQVNPYQDWYGKRSITSSQDKWLRYTVRISTLIFGLTWFSGGAEAATWAPTFPVSGKACAQGTHELNAKGLPKVLEPDHKPR